MSKMCWRILLLSWLVIPDHGIAQSPLLGKIRSKLVSIVAVASLIGSVSLAAHKLQLDFHYDAEKFQDGQEVLALNDADLELTWKRIRNNPPAHQKSVFYLLLDGFDIGWRVMHIEYIGDSKKGEPLFVGPRVYLLSGVDRNGEPKFVLHWAQPSLVGYKGLIKQNVEVEEIAYFSHPFHSSYDQTLITIKDVNLSEYDPISIAAQPEPGTDLVMLSYRVRDEDVLKFFNYPLEQRNCNAIDFDTEDLMVVHSCHIPYTPAVIASPIFAKDTLVALYYGVTNNEDAYGAALLPELLTYMAKTLDVNAQDKTATMWGEMKVSSSFKPSSY